MTTAPTTPRRGAGLGRREMPGSPNYYWLDDAQAADFARLVEIHRKPGYDPAELLVGPAAPSAATRRAAAALARVVRQAHAVKERRPWRPTARVTQPIRIVVVDSKFRAHSK